MLGFSAMQVWDQAGILKIKADRSHMQHASSNQTNFAGLDFCDHNDLQRGNYPWAVVHHQRSLAHLSAHRQAWVYILYAQNHTVQSSDSKKHQKYGLEWKTSTGIFRMHSTLEDIIF